MRTTLFSKNREDIQRSALSHSQIDPFPCHEDNSRGNCYVSPLPLANNPQQSGYCLVDESSIVTTRVKGRCICKERNSSIDRELAGFYTPIE